MRSLFSMGGGALLLFATACDPAGSNSSDTSGSTNDPSPSGMVAGRTDGAGEMDPLGPGLEPPNTTGNNGMQANQPTAAAPPGNADGQAGAGMVPSPGGMMATPGGNEGAPGNDQGAAPPESAAQAPEAEPPPSDAADAGMMDLGTQDFEPLMTWRTGTPMPTPRTELAVALLGDRIYVAGGFGGFNAFESYAPDSDSWETHADLPVGLQHPSLAAVGGHVYLTGGRQTGLFAYDPSTDAWTERASMPQARYAAAAVALGDGLYVVGGTGDDALAIWHYDPASDAWSRRGELDMVRDHLTVVALAERLYIIGGRPGGGDVYNSVQIYDPADQSLTPGPAMQEGRSGFGAAAVGPWICAAGGEVLISPYFVRDTAECLDPERGTWALVDPLPRPLHGVGAAGYKGRMYLFGGAERAASASPRRGWVHILEP
ncbi:MAG: hypothetical protein OXR73_00480 [Myxococcales bacterium]|nr:hypothetical protein [Myxococcales bacterium]